MWIFLFLFFAVSAGFTVMSLSLSENNKSLVIGAGVIALATLVYYPYAIELTNQSLKSAISNSKLVHSISLLQIFESIILLGVAVMHVKYHYQTKPRSKQILSYLNLFPSIVFLIGLFFIQGYFFLSVEGISYWAMTIGFALTTFFVMVISPYIIKLLIHEWDLRAEFKMLISLFQILLAMFLPLIVRGIQVPFTNLSIEAQPITITAITIISISLLGGLNYFRKEKLKANKLK